MFFTFESAALKIDGFLNENEWKNTQPTVLVTNSDVANCEIDKGIVSIFCDNLTEKIYLGFKVSLTDTVDDENNSYGVSFSVGSDEFVKVTNKGISSYDTDKYSVEAKITAYSDTAFGVEAVIGVKYGLDSVDTVRVRFIDADGSPSNVYSMKILPDSAEKSETVQLQQPVYNNGSTDNEVKTTKYKKAASETKKSKISKSETTKRKTTSSSSEDYVNNVLTTNADANLLAQEETTVMTVKQVKIQKGFTYAAVTVLIILALGICVAVNLARDKEKCKK